MFFNKKSLQYAIFDLSYLESLGFQGKKIFLSQIGCYENSMI